MRGSGGIDVIVPCHGYGRFLRECVESVLAETSRQIRVLIIDDASPDHTPDVASDISKRDCRVSWRRHGENHGHIATYNEGIDWVEADYMLLLSADDFVAPGALSRAADLLDSQPAAGLAYGPAKTIRDDQPGSDTLFAPPEPGWKVFDGQAFLWRDRHDWRADPIETCTAVTRTAVQRAIGGYRPELPHTGDFEMWLRFAARGPVGRLNAIQGVYRRHAKNMSSAYYDNLLDDLRERVRATDMFLSENSGLIRSAGALRTHYEKDLARLCLDYASDMFVAGRAKAFDDLLRLAQAMDPALPISPAWWKQHFKRLVGPKLWLALKRSLYGPVRLGSRA